ncbi:MAG: elongation factor G [Ardenticatenaceae bacterium]|nr:elongation factor G [Ardenticatenaceae bacterium]HBY98249.1 elongation factor G [Chloroflexota bacterium]
MKSYQPADLRNVALVSHGGAGKTTLAEAMLYKSGATTRQGNVEEGNTVSDFDPEEQRRQVSINTSVIPVEWRDCKINLIDTPGYADFAGDAKSGLRVADSAVIVVDAVAGPEVGTELMWQYASERELPRMVFVNKMDRDNARFDRALERLREVFDNVKFVALQIPMGQGGDFRGVIDVIERKAYTGAGKPGEIPGEYTDQVDVANVELMEAAAEADDELLLKYLDGEELTPEEVWHGLKAGVLQGSIVPVLAGSSKQNIGISALASAICDLLPSPLQALPEVAELNGAEVELKRDPNSPLAVLVFKTIADPFGKVSYLRVFSGTLHADSRVLNPRTGEEERIAQLYNMRGKEQLPTKALVAGDIGGVVKLSETATGDTLADRANPYVLKPIKFPDPVFVVAIFPKSQSDVDKLMPALQRLVEEDPTLRAERQLETRQTLLQGLGDQHIDVARNRLESKYGVHINIEQPRVPYRETVARTAAAQYRHKKQTGGAGQFAEVHMRVEPLPRSEGFEFANAVFGGAISNNFMPSIEKGVKSVLEQGVIAGYPVVDVKAVVYDGKEHPVDSKDIAFQVAGREAFKSAFREASPILLEPIYTARVTVPEQFMGDIMGDFNTRRGRILNMEQERGKATITALVPLAEMLRYATDLRSMTQGRGLYTVELSHYDPVPAHLAQNIVAQAKKEREEE